MMKLEKTERDSFAHLLVAEWTTFRKARGFLIAIAVAALIPVFLGLVVANLITCGPNGRTCSAIPVGPGGEAVDDTSYFVHQPLARDGSMTVRVTSLTGLITYPPPKHDQFVVSGVVSWAKAGIMIKENTQQGSAYAAVMITGSHGVRMQYNFLEDMAGNPGDVFAQSPRWLRLTREGSILTGYESTDGVQWTRVGTAHLAGLPSTVQIGLFVTSPCNLSTDDATCRLTQATATFDHVSLTDSGSSGAWVGTKIGGHKDDPALSMGSLHTSGEMFTVTGSGDIAPLGAGGGWPIERFLIGTIIGLLVVIVAAVLFAAAKRPVSHIYASKRRGQVLAAKAVVIGLVTFTTQLVAALIAVQIGKHMVLSHGAIILSVSPLTELRVMVGTAALVGVAAVFALSLGTLFRHRVVAVMLSIALTVLPFILAFAGLVPDAWSQWLLRLTPDAGFAIQQSIPAYPQVISLYTPQFGYYPLAPWAGFAVLCCYTAFALSLAIFLLHRRDR
ncbi:hypothetical protein [Ktedonospora formicarum]|uniref:ABC transporter permease n=1 Tax=Ktedonospora formicarum TaxID=2778364 RepID=A0A8J3I045_9CHLR|nr:hypothetical protein [Ktedonospora formicarum]GHO47477.1 hypothetical protein KSX_56400 [Ktedonospora formicarum]